MPPPAVDDGKGTGGGCATANVGEHGSASPNRFEAIALPHLDAAYALARWMTGNDADAADVVQEAFLRAFRYFDSYRGDDAKSWVLKIVRRSCYSWLKRNRPADVVSLEAEEEHGDAVAMSAIDAEGLLEIRSNLRVLDRLIEALPAPLREMIVLRELHELGYRDIAKVTGVPIGTVMSRLHRARSLLLCAYDQTGGAAAASAALYGQEVSPGHRSRCAKVELWIKDVSRDVEITSGDPVSAPDCWRIGPRE